MAREVIAKCENHKNVCKMIISSLAKVDLHLREKLLIFCILQAAQPTNPKINLAVLLFKSSNSTFSQLEDQWSFLSEKSFQILLDIAIKAEKVDLDSEEDLDILLESIFENDYDKSLKSLMEAGAKIPSSSLRTVTVLDKPKCASVLLQYGIDPHIDNDACFIEAATMGHTKILYLMSKFWSQELASKILYTAIENDQVYTVEFLLKLPLVKSDRQSLVLAMDPSRGKIRNEQGQTCLQVLIESNQDITNMTNLSRQAVRSVCNFVESK